MSCFSLLKIPELICLVLTWTLWFCLSCCDSVWYFGIFSSNLTFHTKKTNEHFINVIIKSLLSRHIGFAIYQVQFQKYILHALFIDDTFHLKCENDLLTLCQFFQVVLHLTYSTLLRIYLPLQINLWHETKYNTYWNLDCWKSIFKYLKLSFKRILVFFYLSISLSSYSLLSKVPKVTHILRSVFFFLSEQIKMEFK